MRAHLDEVRAAGASVLVVSFEPPARLPVYREAHGWPFPVVSDSDRLAYQAFGLGSAGWSTLFGPRVVARYAGLMLRGYRAARPGHGDDVHQLGGDFVLDAAHRLVYAHRSADPADRPPAAELLTALRRASPAPSAPPGAAGTS